MKKIRIPFVIAFALALTCFICGSILDLDVARNILVDPREGFGITVAALGLIPAHGVPAFLGGFLIWCGVYSKEKKALRVAIAIGGAVAIVLATYFSGDNVFDENGFDNKDIAWLGSFITFPFMALFGGLGFLSGKKVNNPDLWIITTIVLLACGIALFCGVIILKNIFHRPRFRYVVRGGLVEFHNWWKPFKGYKDYAGLKEEFKSFPSGHTLTAFMLIPFAGYISIYFKKLEKYTYPLLCAALAYCVFMAISRMWVGAHYLSDVSMGGLLGAIFFLATNELLIRNKKINESFAKEE